MSNENNSRPALPFSRGLAWLVQAVTLMRLQPGRLLLIAVFMQVVLGLTQLPLIGILVILCVPALSAGVLEAFEVTGQGGRPGLNLLFKPFSSGTRMGQLFLMGVLVFAVGVASIAMVLSGAEMPDAEMMSRIEQGDLDAITQIDQESLGKMVLAFLVGLGVSGTLSYFTIPLLWFGGRKLGPALLQGLKALFVQWRPFLVLAMGLVATSIPVMVVTGFLIGMASSGGLLSVVLMGFIMLLLLAFQVLLYATQYCAYRDVFGSGPERSADGPPGDDSRLVA